MSCFFFRRHSFSFFPYSHFSFYVARMMHMYISTLYFSSLSSPLSPLSPHHSSLPVNKVNLFPFAIHVQHQHQYQYQPSLGPCRVPTYLLHGGPYLPMYVHTHICTYY